MNKNLRDMDSNLKEEIRRFLIKQGEDYQGHARDVVDDLEEYLKEKGFDLGCVNQYKNGTR